MCKERERDNRTLKNDNRTLKRDNRTLKRYNRTHLEVLGSLRIMDDDAEPQPNVLD